MHSTATRRHVYSFRLKGSDEAVYHYQSLWALGYEPVLYLYYRDEDDYPNAIIDKVIKFSEEECDLIDILCENGGLPVTGDDTVNKTVKLEYESEFGKPEYVDWVTPVTEFNSQKDAYVYYGNEASLKWAYGNVCLVVRIEKAGEEAGVFNGC